MSGKPRSGRLWAKADVHSGRALIEVRALINNGGDRVAFHLDAEPDRNKFDLATIAVSPADGLLPATIGTNRAINLRISGKGSWTRWRGAAALDLSGRPAARFALGVDRGQYRPKGMRLLLNFSPGKLRRLLVPGVTIRGFATLKDRILDGQLTAASPNFGRL